MLCVDVCIRVYVYFKHNISPSWNLPYPSYKHVPLLAILSVPVLATMVPFFPTTVPPRDPWLPTLFMSELSLTSFSLGLLTFLLTQYKAWMCFHKETLNYLSILYCTQTFLHPKTFYHSSPVLIPHFLLYSQFLCSIYTYFLNIVFPTLISLKFFF